MKLTGNRTALLRCSALALALSVWVLALRAPTFLRPVISWDESLYLLIARQWLDGQIPYVTTWDHKPIGIYGIFSAALLSFGDSVTSIRIAAVLAVLASALCIHVLARRHIGSSEAALVAAFAYPAFSLGLGGLAANTELFFSPLTLLGLICLSNWKAAPRNSPVRGPWLLSAGLSLGLAIQVKYLAAFEAMFFGVVLICVLLRPSESGRSLREIATGGGIYAIGLMLPTLGAIAYFHQHGALDAFVQANFLANLNHAGYVPSLATLAVRLASSLLKWVKAVYPIMLFGGVAIASRATSHGQTPGSTRRTVLVLSGWLATCLLGAWSTRRFYDHYYLTTLPPLCLLLAYGLMQFASILGKKTAVAALAALLFVLPVIEAYQEYHVWHEQRRRNAGLDPTYAIAAYLNSELDEGDSLFVGNDQPIFYYLTRARCPTKFAFPGFWFHPGFDGVAGLDFDGELKSVLEQRPKFILVREGEGDRVRKLVESISPLYRIDRTFRNEVSTRTTVYRRAR